MWFPCLHKSHPQIDTASTCTPIQMQWFVLDGLGCSWCSGKIVCLWVFFTSRLKTPVEASHKLFPWPEPKYTLVCWVVSLAIWWKVCFDLYCEAAPSLKIILWLMSRGYSKVHLILFYLILSRYILLYIYIYMDTGTINMFNIILS